MFQIITDIADLQPEWLNKKGTKNPDAKQAFSEFVFKKF